MKGGSFEEDQILIQALMLRVHIYLLLSGMELVAHGQVDMVLVVGLKMLLVI